MRVSRSRGRAGPDSESGCRSPRPNDASAGPASVTTRRRARRRDQNKQATDAGPAGRSENAQTDAPYQVGNGIVSPSSDPKVDPTYTTAAMNGRNRRRSVAGRASSKRMAGVGPIVSGSRWTRRWAWISSARRGQPSGSSNLESKDGKPVRVAVQLILEFRLKPRVYTTDTPGLVAPVVRDHPDPTYTSDAMRAKIQGTVKVEAVVQAGRHRHQRTNRRVARPDVRTRRVGAQGARQWTFEPGTLNGTAVPVRVVLTLEFRLH